MARLTKQQTKAHDNAESLLSLTRPLTHEEVENVFEWWSPMASHNVGKNAVFFTPSGLAYDFAECAAISEGGARYLDLCAGIGRLTYAMMQRNRWDAKPSQYVCLELNPDFVEVGKKLMPQAQWVCGSAFDLELLRPLGAGRRERKPISCQNSKHSYGLTTKSANASRAPSGKSITLCSTPTPNYWRRWEVLLRLPKNNLTSPPPMTG